MTLKREVINRSVLHGSEGSSFVIGRTFVFDIFEKLLITVFLKFAFERRTAPYFKISIQKNLY